MNQPICKHCGGKVEPGEESCTHCGMPLPPEADKTPQQKFMPVFIMLVIICAAMILWLPRDLIQ